MFGMIGMIGTVVETAKMDLVLYTLLNFHLDSVYHKD